MGRVWRDTPNKEWGRKARKEEDRIRGLNNQAHRAAVAEQLEQMEEEK